MIKIQIICQYKINHFLDAKESLKWHIVTALPTSGKGRGPTRTRTFHMSLSVKVKALKLFNDLRVGLIVHSPDFISLNENSWCMQIKFGFHYFFLIIKSEVLRQFSG